MSEARPLAISEEQTERRDDRHDERLVQRHFWETMAVGREFRCGGAP
jgi:hypothetical protein